MQGPGGVWSRRGLRGDNRAGSRGSVPSGGVAPGLVPLPAGGAGPVRPPPGASPYRGSGGGSVLGQGPGGSRPWAPSVPPRGWLEARPGAALPGGGGGRRKEEEEGVFPSETPARG